jgi:hypothetical protein
MSLAKEMIELVESWKVRFTPKKRPLGDEHHETLKSFGYTLVGWPDKDKAVHYSNGTHKVTIDNANHWEHTNTTGQKTKGLTNKKLTYHLYKIHGTPEY